MSTDMPTRKPRAKPDLGFVLHPEADTEYVHFQDSKLNPFDPRPLRLGRRNAWWLADAALLAYCEPSKAVPRFQTAGFLKTEFVDVSGVQCYVSWTNDFIVVAFRGTQPDQFSDVFDDAVFRLVPWSRPSALVHAGFKGALDRVWPRLTSVLSPLVGSRTTWFTGHSLGAALATLAADRSDFDSCVCTLGSPRVGNEPFATGFNSRFGNRGLRYVSDADIVTHVPPPLPLPYAHVDQLRYIGTDGSVGDRAPPLAHFFNELIGQVRHIRETVELLRNGTMQAAPDFLLDHMPRGYATDIWNDYADHGD
jgi:triacylglycerol lipase